MPQRKVENLISELHEMYGSDQPSPQQQQLLADLERHIHPAGLADEPEPVPLDTLEQLVEEVAKDHPRSAAVMFQVLETLKNMGV